MGQKINPIGFRVGVTRDWESRWYAPKKQYRHTLYEDYLIRRIIKQKWYGAGISRIEIERAANIVRIIIYAARPGQIIGRGGQGIEEVNRAVLKALHPNKPELRIDVEDVRNPDQDAQLVAENIASQLERRISHRRAIRQTLARAQRMNLRGIKVMVAGRLGGAEIARTEWDRWGRVPLQTLRADIDYGFATAYTIYGTIGVKVWIYKGDIPMSERRILLSSVTTPESGMPGEARRGAPSGRPGDRPAGRRRGGGGRRRQGVAAAVDAAGAKAVAAAGVAADPRAASHAHPAHAAHPARLQPKRLPMSEVNDYVDAETNEISQATTRTTQGRLQRRTRTALRRLRAGGDGTRMDYQPPDGSGARRYRALPAPRRQNLVPYLPR
jgi:small subunit ribosomal protein S3